MSWTDERVETLKELWAEGKSASQIAKEMGGVTRNAVIGKVHRLGLSNRAKAAAAAKAAEEPKAAAKAEEKPAAKKAAAAAEAAKAEAPKAGAAKEAASDAKEPAKATAKQADAKAEGEAKAEDTAKAEDGKAEATPAELPQTVAITVPAERQRPVIRDATQPRAPGAPTPEEIAARATLIEIEKFVKRISLLELTERVCKWPIGDPNDEDFAFCGLDAVPGKPYCSHHIAIAFQPMSSRRDRARARASR